MKPESRENILQEIAEAKQQIAHLRKKQEEAEITLQLLNELNTGNSPRATWRKCSGHHLFKSLDSLHTDMKWSPLPLSTHTLPLRARIS